MSADHASWVDPQSVKCCSAIPNCICADVQRTFARYPLSTSTCSTFRDLNFAIADQIAEGDKVTTRWSVSGIHQGTFAGIPTIGKPIAITAINIHRVVDGPIQEGWLNWDALGLLQQLGASPL